MIVGAELRVAGHAAGEQSGLQRQPRENANAAPRGFAEARNASEMFLGVRVNVWASWAAVVLGIVLYLVQRRRHTGDEPSPYVPGREWTGPDAEVDSDETESDSDSLDEGVEGENIKGETAATSSSRSTTP